MTVFQPFSKCVLMVLSLLCVAFASTSPGLLEYQAGWAQLSKQNYKTALQQFDKSYTLLPTSQQWMPLDGKA